MIEIRYKHVPKMKKEEELIKKLIKTILGQEGLNEEVEVYILLTDNDEIKKINMKYRNLDKPTDVLSFPMYEHDELNKLKKIKVKSQMILGDIIVSMEKVVEQSVEYGHSKERELLYLITHGMLHLLGYDHMKKTEEKIMRKKEEKILDFIGVKRV